ncbi:MAG: hypothetical protein ABI980_11070 [Nitrospirota bacterium]
MSSGKVLSGGPGIVVLSHSLEVLHMNHQAIKLACLLDPAQPNGQPPNNATGILPLPLTDLAGKVLSMLQSRLERSENGQFEIRYSANEPDKLVHLRGVGVPDRHGVAHARIVLILTEASAHHSENHQNNGSVV